MPSWPGPEPEPRAGGQVQIGWDFASLEARPLAHNPGSLARWMLCGLATDRPGLTIGHMDTRCREPGREPLLGAAAPGEGAWDPDRPRPARARSGPGRTTRWRRCPHRPALSRTGPPTSRLGPTRPGRVRTRCEASSRLGHTGLVKAGGIGTSARARVSETNVWQFSLLPGTRAYPGATPIEARPLLGSVVPVRFGHQRRLQQVRVLR